MLAPIITKDMRLFPSQKLPPCVWNVRSRAQSLDHFTQLQNSGSSRGRIIPVRPRTSASTGNLPTSSATRSPPKVSVHRKTTLTAIQEGVEMTSTTIPTSRSESSSVQSAASSSGSNRSSQKKKNLEAKRDRSPKSTSSESSEPEKKKSGVLKWISRIVRRGSKEKDSKTDATSTISN